MAFVLAGLLPASPAAAQQPVTPAALVFDHVTVVDVARGKLVPAQRVVVAGNRIERVGQVDAVKSPRGAMIVDARGKYLIPGLWDMHLHHEWDSLPHDRSYLPYLLLIANGVTGFRDASMDVPLDTAFRWRREILAGTRVGPPRQLLGGPRLIPSDSCTGEAPAWMLCVVAGDSAGDRRIVEARKAAGVEMLKIYTPSWDLYAAARRVGLPFGGHAVGAYVAGRPSPAELSDSGSRILDHSGALGPACAPETGSLDACRKVAESFRRNGTWWVPTCIGVIVCGGRRTHAIGARFQALMEQFIRGSVANPYAPDSAGGNALGAAMPGAADHPVSTSEPLLMHLAHEAGIPVLAGTDVMGASQFLQRSGGLKGAQLSGFALHAELAMDAAEGLTPLAALRSATLNPATFLHAADSLGTVAPGKLADLVLLDADPLADITNTTTICAVVANGRYFDRAALDRLLAEARASSQGAP